VSTAENADAGTPAPAAFAPEPGIGLPVAIASFGFSVLVLGLADARVFTPNAIGFFAPVAIAFGAFGLGIGGLFELRANNTFAGTFALLYSGFLLSTGLILRFFSPAIIDAAGEAGFGDAFGAWLLLWFVFTAMLSAGAFYINMPAFLAFTLLALGYLLLGLASTMEASDTTEFLTKAGGWVLVIDGIVAWYLAWALAMNSLIGDKLPLWPHPYFREESAPEVPAGIAPTAAA
jgi:succinate-acetate transporter protein